MINERIQADETDFSRHTCCVDHHIIYCTADSNETEITSSRQETEEAESISSNSRILIAYTGEAPVRFAAEQTEAAVGGTLWEISDTSLENFETYETVIIAFEADSGQLPGTVRNF